MIRGFLVFVQTRLTFYPANITQQQFVCLKVSRFIDSQMTVFVTAILFTAVIFDWEITLCQVYIIYMYVCTCMHLHQEVEIEEHSFS